MFSVMLADERAAKMPCRAGCKKHITEGQVVLQMVLPGNVDIPYNQRRQYLHVDCVTGVLANAPVPVPSYDALFMENLRRQVVETGELFPAA